MTRPASQLRIIPWLAFAVALATHATSHASGFDAGAIVGTLGFPNRVTIGDVNADGKLDLVTANVSQPPYTISVFLGNGDGSFGTRTDYGTGSSPRHVAIGDLNGDGKVDLVSADLGGSVSSLLGNGDGTFAASTSFPICAACHASWVVIGNLDPDGVPDLVVAYSHSSSGAVLAGLGGGGFYYSGFYSTPAFNQQCAMTDLNGDGKLDVVTTNGGFGTVSVVFGDGLGGFGPYTAYEVDLDANSLALADLNGDGRLDLATANGFSGTASVLLGNGDGTFGSATNYATGPYASSVAIADFDMDGMLDLATASTFNSATVSLLPGNGDGTLGAKTDFNTGTLPKCMAVGDLNGDGRPDLAVGRADSTVLVLLNSFTPVSVDPEPVPLRFALGPPHPNPFHARATFDLAIPTPSSVRLEIYDLQGRWIRTLEDGVLPAGRTTRSWDGTRASGSDAGTGVYLLRLSAPGVVLTRKVLLAR